MGEQAASVRNLGTRDWFSAREPVQQESVQEEAVQHVSAAEEPVAQEPAPESEQAVLVRNLAPAEQKLNQALLKVPMNAYISWLGDNRKSIIAKVGKEPSAVIKKASQMWKALPANQKKPYEDRAIKAKEKREAYIASVKDTKAF